MSSAKPEFGTEAYFMDAAYELEPVHGGDVHSQGLDDRFRQVAADALRWAAAWHDRESPKPDSSGVYWTEAEIHEAGAHEGAAESFRARAAKIEGGGDADA